VMMIWILALAAAAAPPADDQALVAALRHRIVAKSVEKTPAAMKAYKAPIPGSDAAYEMVPIPGGTFQMGSKGKPDEQPVHAVTVEPFWMGKYEVTWDQYRLFQFATAEIQDAQADAVSHPTRPYMEMSFGMGINGYPAISMTQHAANKYAQWLSARTGHFYRLPTEAEWEYACRADGAAAKLEDVAWYEANSKGKYAKVGTKQPNAWGLYDMLGNVMEWTLDAYVPYAAGAQKAPWTKSKTAYPHAVRGGSWNDKADQLSCTARVASDRSWKMQDPQLPKSIWYLTDAQWLGFRVVRPLKTPAAAEMDSMWNNGVEVEP